MSRTSHRIGRFLRALVRRLVRIYYSRVEVSGGNLLPSSGPILFVANHPNSLMDPVMIGIAASRPVHFLAKAPLFDLPVFGSLLSALGMIPAFRGSDDPSEVKRNLESINVGAEYLAQNEAVGIFPEGKSHDLTRVELIRSGAARIALNAYEAGVKELQIIPLGLNYEQKDRFRSAVWIQIGRPIKVAEIARTETDPKRILRQLTQEITARLKEVVIHLDDARWEHLLPDLETLLPAPGVDGLVILKQRKRIADAINYFFKNQANRAELNEHRLTRHEEKLRQQRIPFDAMLLAPRLGYLLPPFIRTVCWVVFGFLPALVGTLHHFIPFFLVRGLARMIGPNSRSTIALFRLGLGLPIYGAWYATVWWWMAGYFTHQVATFWICLMPFAGIVALNYWRRFSIAMASFLPQVLLCFRPAKLRHLRAERLALQNVVGKLSQQYLEKFPGEKAPPSGSWKLAWQRTAIWFGIVLLMGAAGGWGLWWIHSQWGPEFRAEGPSLGIFSTGELESQLAEDEATMLVVLDGIRELKTKANLVAGEFESGKRSFYRQEDDDAARSLILDYLNYRSTLLNLAWKYQNYDQVRNPSLRSRCFLAHFCAASSLYDLSFKVVDRLRKSPEMVRKLNEPEPRWEVPGGIFNTALKNLQQPQTEKFFTQGRRHYLDYFGPTPITSADVSSRPFHEAIDVWKKTWDRRFALVGGTLLVAPAEETVAAGKSASYHIQSFVSTWVGNTRVRNPRAGKSLIQPADLKSFQEKLEPGDILLERQNWYLSRALMPGYWAHVALYAGSTEELEKMGLLKDTAIADLIREQSAKAGADYGGWVLEAVPVGVRLTTFHHCISVADSAAALRPRLTPAQKKQGIARAFAHLGKPYDFDFDFFSTDKLVCTELVYRAYDGSLQFPLVEVMGRKTLPPTEMVRKYVSDKSRPEPEMSFVAFLDGNERKNRAYFGSENSFCETVHRPSMTWRQPQSGPP